MKLVSKKTNSDGTPLFIFTETTTITVTRFFKIEQLGSTYHGIFVQTRKGYELELFLVDKLVKIFISNREVYKED